MPTVADHIAHVLAHRVRHAFGVMGNGNAHLLDAIERRTAIDYVPVRHEAGGVAAADAYARSGGGLAVATATYGAGFTNTLTPLAEAAQARIPLLLVVGDEPTAGPRPWDVGQAALAAAVGVRTFTVGRADAAATTLTAIEQAIAHRVPVVLAIPYDLAHAEAGPLAEVPPPIRPVPSPLTPFAQARVRAIAGRLAAARRPLLLAGRGAHLAGAGAALGRLADATGAVTGTTAIARGLFPRSEFDLGVTGGFGAEGAMSLFHEADAVLVFGAGLNQFTTRFGELFAPGTDVVQIDLAPAATHPHVRDYLRGDAALVAELLTQELAAIGARPSGWRESLDIAPLRAYDAAPELAADGRLDPRAAATRIGELLPADRVVVSDGGHFIGWANMYWPVAEPERMLMVGTAYQTIGLGLPSVPGAAAARPESTIVLTAGDGGTLMALADLESAVRTAAGRGLAVIWNDAAYGAEVHLYGRKGLAPAPMLIPETDFAALARAVGAEGVVVRRLADLEALAEWAGRDPASRPFLLLDVRISRSVIAPYQHEVIRVNR